MKFSFDTNIAFILFILFVILAFAGSMLVYYKNKENSEFTKTQKRTLSVLRFTTILLCLILFLKPILISKKKIKEKPIIVLATDNSQSLSKYKNQIAELSNTIEKTLEKKYEIDKWSFGQQTRTTDSLSFSDTKSDYSDLFTTISNQYINKNVGALVVLGDGIYNSGYNPLNQLSSYSAPIYCIGLGDTIRIADARISNVTHNPTVFLNNLFAVEADIHFEMMASKTAQIELINNGKTIETRSVAIPNNSFFSTEKFTVQASQKGLQKYQVKIRPVDNEANTSNNTYNFVVDVIDTKHKVLILSDAPHPDIGTIKEVLESFGNFEVTLVNGNKLSEKNEDFDLFVLYQLPSQLNFNSSALTSIINSGKPLLIIVGDKTSIPYLNNLQLGITSTVSKGQNESQLKINKDFSLFKIENDLSEQLESFPPLNVKYADFTFADNFQIIGTQKIKGIVTPNPLMAIGKLEKRKIGFILGEGLWKWRIHDYETQHQFTTINNFIYKIFNYLCLKENDENFRLNYSTTYTENEDVIIGAELYNDSYEMTNSPEASLLLKKDSTSEFNFIFDKINNQYSLNLGKPEPGTYKIEAKVKLGDKEYIQTGNFSILKINLEDQQTVANHQILHQIAYETGGKFYRPQEIEKLFSEIESNKEIKTDKLVQFSQNELLNSKWLFFFIILLFGLEWFLRKYWGIY